ncbi:MAG: capsular polysaccharide biosynthesis protein [Clostridiales bacterium]|nr:capsular polysaccharide biosynthesis protein [Clostridiales bacterium]
MIDVHCHMLPGIDDGSKDVAMSLEMISRSVEQGVEGIIFTPHFYADMNSPETFLRKRDKALHELEDNLGSLPKVPVYTTGAEVHYFRGMSRSKDIERLCIGKSDYMLIEMPFRNWQPNMIDEIEEISLVLGLRVIIAHIERYFDQDKKLVNRLLENPNLLIQCNAEFFIEKSTYSKAIRLLKTRRIDLLGTDSHNLTSRRPNMAEAIELIQKKDKKDALGHIIRAGRRIFDAAL